MFAEGVQIITLSTLCFFEGQMKNTASKNLISSLLSTYFHGSSHLGEPPYVPGVFCCLFVLWLYLGHMEVPRQGVESQLQLPAHVTATTKRDPSHVFDLCCSLQEYQMPNPLSEARD